MTIGIITDRCKSKKRLFDKIFLIGKRIILKEQILNGFKVISAEVFSNKRNKEKLYCKAEKKLKKICDIVFDVGNYEVFNTKKFFYEISIYIYKNLASDDGIKPYRQKILIADEKLSVLNKKRMEAICFWCSECNIYSQNILLAEKLCLYMQQNCGAFFKCSDSYCNILKYDVVFDVDKNYIKIGKNIFINKFDFGLEDISKKFAIPQLTLATIIYESGINPHLLGIEGRTAIFSFKHII